LNTKSPEHLLHYTAVRIETKLKKETGRIQAIQGSGVIYFTSQDNETMYVFTALHCILGPRIKDTAGNNIYKYELSDLESIDVGHNPKLDAIQFNVESIDPINAIIDKVNDFCILKVKKSLVAQIPNFPRLVVHQNKRSEGKFRSAGFTTANRNNLTFLFFHNPQISPDGILNVNAEDGIQNDNARELIGGYSGSGLFMQKGSVLIGLITKLNDESAFGNNVHVRDLSFVNINNLLRTNDTHNELIVYTSHANHILNEENGEIVDLSQVPINGVHLNLWKAVGNVKKDQADDWFLDPQRMRDFFTSENLYKIIQSNLVGGRYYASGAELFNIPKEGFTTRKAVQTCIVDRVIYQAAVDYIAKELDKKIIRNNIYSVRYNYNQTNNNDYFFYHSVEQWRKFQYQIYATLSDEMPYLVATDITSFYDHISSDSLSTILTEFGFQASNKTEFEAATSLVIDQIRKWQNDTSTPGYGIPQNREPSAFLANVFLAKVDNHMSNYFPHYYRYMDDIRILCKNKFEARKALMILIDKLNEIGLNLNAQKTKILNKNDEEDKLKIFEYTPALDKQIEQICSLMDSGKAREVQISVMMVNEMFHESIKKPQDLEHRKKFKFAIERLQRFARTPVLSELINFTDIVQAITERFEDNPWYTEIYTRFLMTVESDYITDKVIALIVPLVTNEEKNIYPWQAYQIFKLMAYHKIENNELKGYANNMVSQPHGPDKSPIVAGACLYLSTTDNNAIGTIKSALLRKHFMGQLANRCAMISLQSIAPSQLVGFPIDSTMAQIHKQAYEKYVEKGVIAPIVAGFPKLKINSISRDLPQIISL